MVTRTTRCRRHGALVRGDGPAFAGVRKVIQQSPIIDLHRVNGPRNKLVNPATQRVLGARVEEIGCDRMLARDFWISEPRAYDPIEGRTKSNRFFDIALFHVVTSVQRPLRSTHSAAKSSRTSVQLPPRCDCRAAIAALALPGTSLPVKSVDSQP